jgi:hypothetical protein
MIQLKHGAECFVLKAGHSSFAEGELRRIFGDGVHAMSAREANLNHTAGRKHPGKKL